MCMKLKTAMRRLKKTITDMDYVESIMREAPVGILSLCKDNEPYAIPVNFYYAHGKIYIHCAQEGRKVSYIQANPQVCFSILHPVELSEAECGGAVNYESVLCFGTATFSESSSLEVLSNLGRKYDTCSEITEEQCQKTAMIVMEIDEVSAKKGY